MSILADAGGAEYRRHFDSDRRAQRFSSKGAGPMVKQGRIRQSFSHWCFADHWSVEQSVAVAKQLGLDALDLIEPKHFPLLKKEGIQCAICPIDMSPDAVFVKGYNNPEHHP